MSDDHELALYRSALEQSRNAADAWDLVQDAFERALRKRPTVRSGQELRSWLMVVLHNRFIDGWRSPRVSQRALVDVDAVALVECEGPAPIWREHGMEEVLLLVDHLGSRLREVFVPYTAGERVAEIAKRLELPASKVSARLFRARGQIRQMLLGRPVVPRIKPPAGGPSTCRHRGAAANR